jgi:hypothetical protein
MISKDQKARYYGQFLQDEFISNELLNNKFAGVFVDIGVFNGVKLSNTLFLEKSLGWKGGCVEPILDRST